MPDIVVFDLDGTLAHTAPDLIAAMNRAFVEVGLPPVAAQKVQPVFTPNIRALMERLVAGAFPLADIEALYQRFLDIYGGAVCVETKAFPGVREALSTLEHRGVRLAVCTSKRQDHARAIIAGLGLAPFFSAVCGRDTFAWRKPDPRALLSTIAAAGGDPRRAVMVGDSRPDADMAQGAGIPCLLFPFGYSAVPVESLAAAAVVPDWASLVDAVDLVDQAAGKASS
ncbi:MAG: HAD-IA family hydrolase [Methylobacteriaceae bacterium]|jgi:phosphoglycolate phosphatase|nr:HAD-IA family hydrolase [Methylobacteriaceae bacterium]